MATNGKRKTSCLALFGFLSAAIPLFIFDVVGLVAIALILFFRLAIWYQEDFVPAFNTNPVETTLQVVVGFVAFGFALMFLDWLRGVPATIRSWGSRYWGWFSGRIPRR